MQDQKNFEIYNTPLFKVISDVYVEVEYGNSIDISLSFKVNALNSAIKKRKIDGILETVMTIRSLGIVFNPLKISSHELIEELKRLNAEDKLSELGELPSRLLKIPVWFNDPWSFECARAHGLGNNLEFISKLNNVTIDEIIRIYTSCYYWIAGMAFLIGSFGCLPLKPKNLTLNVPKYEVPRKWTFERAVTIAGASVAVFSVRAPGGYQLVGRTPIDIYDPQQRNPIFKKNPILAKPTDRVEFYAISENEYYSIRKQVKQGDYKYIIHNETYRISNYGK